MDRMNHKANQRFSISMTYINQYGESIDTCVIEVYMVVSVTCKIVSYGNMSHKSVTT